MVNRLLVLNTVLMLALLGGWWGRASARGPLRVGNPLEGLQIPFKGWKTADVPLQAHDLDLLQPDGYLIRSYEGPQGQSAQLAVIAGHRKRSIHTPAFCMAGGGWETLWQSACDITLPDRRIPASRMLMEQRRQGVLVTYFFTDGQYSTRSLLAFQGHQILLRLKRRLPSGALVRIIVPVTGPDESAALRLTSQFARSVLPPLLDRLAGQWR